MSLLELGLQPRTIDPRTWFKGHGGSGKFRIGQGRKAQLADSIKQNEMNDRLLEILNQREDFKVTPEEKKVLDFFMEYLDHGSLFMTGFEPLEDPLFRFTNDAQLYTFKLSEICEYVRGMKHGRAMDWDTVPFEYVTRD